MNMLTTESQEGIFYMILPQMRELWIWAYPKAAVFRFSV